MSSSPLDVVREHGIGLINQSLQGVIGQAAVFLTDDQRYRQCIVDPAWELMPIPIKLIGRNRLRWDDLFLAIRDEVLVVKDGAVALRGDAPTRIAQIAGRLIVPSGVDMSSGDRRTAPASPDVATGKSDHLMAAPAGQSTTSPSPPKYAIGIDLGTTYSVIAHLDTTGRPWTIPNAEGDPTTPSVVLFENESIVVGKEALKVAAVEPGRVALCAKRDMGSPVYSKPINGESLPPEVIQSLVLEKLKRDAEVRLGSVQHAVITVPAYFNEPRRKATQDAGQLAGIEVLDIINEPTAAALAYGVQYGFLTPKGEAKAAETVLVYDLGGGTFDVTLMRIDGRQYETIATAGDVHLGGMDWDQRIVDHLAEAFRSNHHGIDPRTNPVGLQRLLREAEEAKRALSARDQVSIVFEYAGHGIREQITRQQFEAMTSDLLDRTRFTTTRLLREAGIDPTALTRLLLVGGSTRMPMVSRMLEQELGIRPDRSLSADEAVAHGAAIYAGLLLASEPSLAGMSVQNVNSHSLGVLSIEMATGRNLNSVLIPRNTPLPVRKHKRFQTRRDGQPSVAVQVIEGGDASGNGSTKIGSCVVRDLPPGLPAGTPIEVTFSYAQNGRLTVDAQLPTIQKAAVVSFDRATGLSRDAMLSWRERLRNGLRPLQLSNTNPSPGQVL